MLTFGILLFLWAISLPITYAYPLYWLEKKYLYNDFTLHEGVGAIVVLGASLTNHTMLPRPNLSENLLNRIRFTSFLQKKTALPILVTGGGFHENITEASVMKKVLEEEFLAKVRWVEERSKTTKENAIFSIEILKEHQIKKIFLVSNSWHLKRAEFLFLNYSNEIEIIPIADYFYADKEFIMERSDFVPSLSTLHYQKKVYSELFAFIYYKYFKKL